MPTLPWSREKWSSACIYSMCNFWCGRQSSWPDFKFWRLMSHNTKRNCFETDNLHSGPKTFFFCPLTTILEPLSDLTFVCCVVVVVVEDPPSPSNNIDQQIIWPPNMPKRTCILEYFSGFFSVCREGPEGVCVLFLPFNMTNANFPHKSRLHLYKASDL